MQILTLQQSRLLLVRRVKDVYVQNRD